MTGGFPGAARHPAIAPAHALQDGEACNELSTGHWTPGGEIGQDLSRVYTMSWQLLWRLVGVDRPPFFGCRLTTFLTVRTNHE
jgi:hypothetical protein